MHQSPRISRWPEADVQSAADAVKIIKQAQSVRQGSPQALMFLGRAVKGTKLKTEAMELLGKLI
jgi:chromosome partitioning protein